MAQFVTHIQPTLVEASHHHPPHYHKETHIKEHHHPHPHPPPSHVKEVDSHHKDGHHKDGHHKDHQHHPHPSHSREFPVLPHPHIEHSTTSTTNENEQYKNKRDSGQYLDSHGVSHTFQLHFIDSQGIHRDYHGHAMDEKEKQKKKDHLEDKSPNRPVQDPTKPTPPQFISLSKGHGDNKNVSIIC